MEKHETNLPAFIEFEPCSTVKFLCHMNKRWQVENIYKICCSSNLWFKPAAMVISAQIIQASIYLWTELLISIFNILEKFVCFTF